MAIDDNTTYGLKGSQVKDLADKINDKADAFVVFIDNKLNNNTTIATYSDSTLVTALSAEDILQAFKSGQKVLLYWTSTIQYTPDWSYEIVSADFFLGGAMDLYAAYSNVTYALSTATPSGNTFSCTSQSLATSAQLTNGSVTKVGTSTVGGTATPIYLNSGTPTAVNKPASGSWFKGVPDISSGGVMEVGKYLDFHNANADTSDYAVRLQTQGNNQVAVNLPSSAGTLALTSQLPLIGYSNAFTSPSNYGYREVDISTIPTGAKFAVFISGYAQVGSGGNFAISSAYNGTQGQEIWSNNSTSGVMSMSMSHIAVYTKAANNKLGFRLGYGQPNELQFYVLAVRIS